MSQHVFVFGTLKEGFPNFPTNKGARVAGDFMTVERYPLYLVGERFSPWLVDAPGEGERVIGQVFEVDEATLAAMDELEQITEPEGYRRVMLDVEAPDDPRGATYRVHAYIKSREQFALAVALLGPLQEYTREHAALYRSREAKWAESTCVRTNGECPGHSRSQSR
ncbi:gamma-glutamylcyclotransferase family protein [Variovorax sp. J22R24]|uniref:gamma-glutamylcyclotransferase family protein n=1 Tax=Variovorax gracilis TaxID=3053502 RepID=UPI002576ADA9|nr:gamma-glutamylcyclotransferase family protein [Variovorax sp. J22R24]MDM0108399.1 gamma-glutamylcyclotransferase family protein [Variovorax sp. J22R24]